MASPSALYVYIYIYTVYICLCRCVYRCLSMCVCVCVCLQSQQHGRGCSRRHDMWQTSARCVVSPPTPFALTTSIIDAATGVHTCQAIFLEETQIQAACVWRPYLSPVFISAQTSELTKDWMNKRKKEWTKELGLTNELKNVKINEEWIERKNRGTNERIRQME